MRPRRVGCGTPARRWRNTEQEYFLQADYSPTSRLTVNASVRYSDFGVYEETAGVAANLYAADAQGRIVPNINPYTYGLTANDLAPVAPDRPLYAPDRNNLSVRDARFLGSAHASRSSTRPSPSVAGLRGAASAR